MLQVEDLRPAFDQPALEKSSLIQGSMASGLKLPRCSSLPSYQTQVIRGSPVLQVPTSTTNIFSPFDFRRTASSTW